MVLPLFRITDLLLGDMRARKWGRILNIASISVVEPIAAIGKKGGERSVGEWEGGGGGGEGDANYWLIRFTPRRPKGKWSQLNRERALVLIKLGRMLRRRE